MIIRSIQQVKVFKLILNPMTDRTEAQRLVAIAYDKNELIDWYNEQFAEESYKDGNYHKTFKKGSPLEWFNPLFDINRIDTFGHGIHWEWTQQDAIDNYVRRANESFGFTTVPFVVPHNKERLAAWCKYCGSTDTCCDDVETETCENLN